MCQITSSQCMMHTARRALAKVAMLWRACSRDFTRVAIYLVVQMDLSRWNVFRCGKLTLHWILDCWQRPSRWANHAITRQQRIDSKIYRIDIEDNYGVRPTYVEVSSAYLLVFAEKQARDTHTHIHIHTHTHRGRLLYICLWGSAHRGIITLCAYAQQGYAFGRVGLRVYMHVCQQKTGCLVPYRSKISC